MTPKRSFVISALLALCLGSAGLAQDAPVPATPAAEAGTQDETGFAPIAGADASLDALIWQKRPIVVFADSPFDPAFKDQMRLLEARWPELAARDVVVITDTTPNPPSDVRLKLRPRGFSLVIIAKDGTVNLRKPRPWDTREIIRSIDKMPIRREEIRNGAQQ
ncbi:MAG: DUF4174 domain-containing protein [Rhodobacteraceae bacterium]|nr:DUF4174 domain-containing protein [Paracoccaceae bacterium]